MNLLHRGFTLWMLGALLAPIAVCQIPMNTTIATVRAKAVPDECWFGIGKNIPFLKPPCFLSKPKVNQAYIWGVTQFRDDIWFGTVANPQCLAEAALLPPESLFAYETDSWACEFDKSPYSPAILPGIIGDFRPPQIMVYNKTTRTLTDLTPKVPVTAANPLGVDPVLLVTRGMRAAATIGNVVLFTGPSLVGGLNFFAFRADTKEYLGSGVLSGYDNIREMLVYNGVLYVPVGNDLVGGKVLRWRGTVSPPPCASCFQFDVVGNLDGVGASIAAHQGRLYVTTWPTGAADSISTIMMSPVVPSGGLTTTDATSWRRVWDVTQYEPDRAVAASYGGGAIASFDGYLYWGTMHVPMFGTAIAAGAYPAPTTDEQWIELLVGSFRSTTLFRVPTFDTPNPQVQLLYGLPVLPAYQPATGHWEFVNNNMPPGTRDPLYGLPGFGNAYNGYSWNMDIWDNRLWVGTMDWSYPANSGTNTIFRLAGQPVPIEITEFFAVQNFGADLYFFQSSASPAVPESNSGVGNYSSFGVRNIIPSGDTLYLGMANESNLLTGPIGPLGGWELIELEKKPGSTPLTLLTGFTCAPKSVIGFGSTQCTVTINRPASNSTVSVGLLPLLFDATATTPPAVTIPNGATSATFTVQVTEPAKAATLYLIASLNDGTMVTPVAVSPGTPRITGQVVGTGKPAAGLVYVDVRITNTGTGAAQDVNLTQILPRVLSGTGTVTLVVGPGFVTSLPIPVGPLSLGDARVVRLYFDVPSTVKAFSITENASLRNLAGTNLNTSLSQTVIP